MSNTTKKYWMKHPDGRMVEFRVISSPRPYWDTREQGDVFHIQVINLREQPVIFKLAERSEPIPLNQWMIFKLHEGREVWHYLIGEGFTWQPRQ